MMPNLFLAILAVAVMAAAPAAHASKMRIYIDADYSRQPATAHAIELGVRTALSEANGVIGGAPVEIVGFDHRANAKRSFLHMQRFIADDAALAMFGGMTSPPYLTYQNYISDNEILLLLPWSAAGPVTRPRSGIENWSFRLSVDDEKAGPFLVRRAFETGCDSPALVLVDTGWGRANLSTMLTEINTLGGSAQLVEMFPPSIGAQGAATLAAAVDATAADCMIMLATAEPGAAILNALDQRGADLRVLSHWGVLGGAFPELVSHETRERFGLELLQTCGLRVEEAGSPLLTEALAKTGSAERLSDIAAPAGFVHGYDLMRLLLAAAEQARETPAWRGGAVEKRRALRQALRALESPVDGILKRYEQPFAPYSADNRDAHEALGLEQLCMARFGADGRLRHSEQRR